MTDITAVNSLNGKKRNNRVSIPSKIKDLLFHDDQFFREVSEINKVKLNKNFPKQDQWCDEEGVFHIEFALAGYTPSDLEIIIENDEFLLRTAKSDSKDDLDNPDLSTEAIEATLALNPDLFVSTEEYRKNPAYPKRSAMQSGIISRGIARRNFSYGLVISQEYDIYNLKAEMQNGLLHISIPRKKDILRKVIVPTN
jgi:HSP20 family molecular chaperone IbpA